MRHIIDAHLHFWDPACLDYPWLREAPDLNKPFTPRDLDTGALPVRQFVFVEADCRPGQRLQETDWILDLANTEPRLAAIVAAAPLESTSLLEPHLDQLKKHPLIKGVRRLFQNEATSFITSEPCLEGARAVARAGFTFDACIRHEQLPELTAFATAVPELQIVLDHMGKPPIRKDERSKWQTDLGDLAALPNTFVKLSGAAPESDPDKDLAAQALPYVREALDLFGPRRCMFGSDWPVSAASRDGATTAAYRQWAEIVLDRAMKEHNAQDQTAVASETAHRFYGIDNKETAG